MKKSYNDSGLTAKRSNRLLAAVLIAAAVSLASCQTTTVIPIDDVYYWDKHEQKAVSATTASPATTAEQTSESTTPSTPQKSIEYVNVQDTTVTIRIK